jgi:hypothetical protein
VRTGVRPRIVEGCRVGVEIPALQHVLMNWERKKLIGG